jgi:hypothetical protein
LEKLPKSKPWRREHGWLWVAREDFRYHFVVQDGGWPALQQLKKIWRWTRSGQLPVRSALLGPGDPPQPPKRQPPAPQVPRGQSSWGVRPGS